MSRYVAKKKLSKAEKLRNVAHRRAAPPRHLQWKSLDPSYEVLRWGSNGPSLVTRRVDQ